MLKSIARGSLAVTLVLLAGLGACTSSDSSTQNIAGTFRMLVTMTQTTCGFEVGEVRENNVVIEQNGSKITILIPAGGGGGVSLSGTIGGNRFEAAGTFTDPPWVLSMSIQGTAGDGGASLSGTMDLSWRNTQTGESCHERGNVAANRL